MHSASPKTKQTTLSPFLGSEKSSGKQKRSKMVPQKKPQMRGIGSNEAASRIDTSPAMGGSQNDTVNQ